jgi:hypothetical protein
MVLRFVVRMTGDYSDTVPSGSVVVPPSVIGLVVSLVLDLVS